MNETLVTSGWQAILLAIPLICILGMTLFRMEELMTAHKGGVENHRGFCALDADGEPLLFDPDGRAFEAKPKIKPGNAAIVVHPLPVALYRAVSSGQTSLLPKQHPSARRRRIYIAKH
jgi:hypothetical protein